MRRAFSLIELLVVMVILLGVVTAIWPSFNHYQLNGRQRAVDSELVFLLRQTRVKALAGWDNVGYGVKFFNDQAVAYAGYDYNHRVGGSEQVFTLPAGWSLTWSLNGTGAPDEINFSRGLAALSRSGQLTVVNQNGSQQLVINELGLVRVVD